jgi:predicted acyltransferase
MSSLQTTAKSTPGSARLVSLDVFRGATIAAMMLVNNPGSWDHVYEQLDHAEWNGWTFTDLIFPFFLWIVGVAVPLSTAKRLERGARRAGLFIHALRRAVIIFGLGLLLAFFTYCVNGSYENAGGFQPWVEKIAGTIRIMGVLQRIAICYLIATAIYLCSGRRAQIAWVIGLLAGYWALMRFGPGHGGLWPLTKEENFARYIDGKVLGKHTWNGAPWDPEGIVSTLPAIATCLFGILTGELLQMKRSVEQKTGWLFVAANLLMFAGAVMNIWLPINKNLWTSSYSVFMAGIAMDIFAVIYWLVDVKGYQRGAKPFAIYGMNAITVFMLSGIFGRILLMKTMGPDGKAVSWQNYLYERFFDTPLSHLGLTPNVCSLSWAIVWMLGLYTIAYGMHRMRWMVKF